MRAFLPTAFWDPSDSESIRRLLVPARVLSLPAAAAAAAAIGAARHGAASPVRD